VQYGWIPGEKSKLLNYDVNIRAEQYNRVTDGKIESMLVSPGIELMTKKGFFTGVSAEMHKEGVSEDFNLSDSITIRAGNYTYTLAQVMFGTPNTKKISLMADVSTGQFYDGLSFGTMGGLIFNLSSSFNISAMYNLNMIRFPSRVTNNTLTIHSVNIKALVMMSTKLSATLMTEYVNTEKNLITNFRIRYNPREGIDFYLVINDYRRVAGGIEIPKTPGFFNKTVMVKYTHTFTL
jgi:hypothetical protein